MNYLEKEYIYITTRIKCKFIRKYYLKKYGLEKTVSTFTSCGGKRVSSANTIHCLIRESISNGDPFMVGRLGSYELQVSVEEALHLNRNREIRNKELQNNAGFFPLTNECLHRFSDTMIDAMGSADVQGIWFMAYEDYALRNYIHTKNIIEARYIEPWFNEEPWTAALKGKKVLVIHPFVKTIESQYENRKLIFPVHSCYLPDFSNLYLVKAVQSAAGNKDERFRTWFEALDYMYNEAMKFDFDVALIGCGAYGYPLASMIKKAGRQAIHLGGVVQAMFGIMGKRWEVDKDPTIRNLYNEHWVRPLPEETPVNANKVEGGCYW